jgi:hypothetical protein
MSQSLVRRNLLAGILGGLTVGGTTGFVSGRGGVRTVAPPRLPEPLPPPMYALSKLTYAQQGEDRVMQQMWRHFRAANPSYVDIGAHEPNDNNNSYLFYSGGSRGLLIEPNPFYADMLRKTRPRDDVLEAGIGPTEATVMADYYVIKGDGQYNTFSKDEADEIVHEVGPSAIERVMKVPLMNINAVLGAHFPEGGPDVFSVDTEGLDLAILKSLDFSRFRPKIVCAETAALSNCINQEILELLHAKNYSPRGGSFVNTIFLDDHFASLESCPAMAAHGGPG